LKLGSVVQFEGSKRRLGQACRSALTGLASLGHLSRAEWARERDPDRHIPLLLGALFLHNFTGRTLLMLAAAAIGMMKGRRRTP
jgi:hypothetical protein